MKVFGELESAQLEISSSNPSVTPLGRIYYNSSSGLPVFRDGSGWRTIPSLTSTSTLQNKTLDNTNTVTIKDTLLTVQDDGDATKQFNFQASGITAGQTRVYTVPDYNGTLATLAGTESLTNKTLDNTNTVTLKDTLLTVQDDGDTAKQFRFQASGITSGQTRVYTVPDYNATLATLAGSESLTNKTLDNTNTVTLKDTLLTVQDDGDATKQFRFQASGITAGQTRVYTVPNFDATLATLAGTESLTNKTLDNTNTVTIKDTLLTVQDDGDATKQFKFQASGITTGTTRTYTVPNADATLATLAGTEAFTNKDYDGGTASNSSRLTLPKAATATLSGLTRKQGTLVYDSTTNQVKFDDGSSLTALTSSDNSTLTTDATSASKTVSSGTSLLFGKLNIGNGHTWTIAGSLFAHTSLIISSGGNLTVSSGGLARVV